MKPVTQPPQSSYQPSPAEPPVLAVQATLSAAGTMAVGPHLTLTVGRGGVLAVALGRGVAVILRPVGDGTYHATALADAATGIAPRPAAGALHHLYAALRRVVTAGLAGKGPVAGDAKKPGEPLVVLGQGDGRREIRPEDVA